MELKTTGQTRRSHGGWAEPHAREQAPGRQVATLSRPGIHRPGAATLPDPVDIYTSTKFADDNAAFDREVQSKAAAQTVIVIAINTQSHHLAIRTGAKSRVTQNAAQAAGQALTNGPP